MYLSYFDKFYNMKPYLSIDEKEWEYIKDTFDKEDVKESLAKVAMTYEIPYAEMSVKDAHRDYLKLKGMNHNDVLVDGEWFAREGTEYRYDLTFEGKHQYFKRINTGNKASNYFQQVNRWSVDGSVSPGPQRTWESEKFMTSLMGSAYSLKLPKINRNVLRTMIGLRKYICAQFKPNVAKAIYHMTDAKKVLDTSCGWGDRLAGFYTSDAEEYIGCDPNPGTFQKYYHQIETYEKFLGNKNVKIFAGQSNQNTPPYITVEGKKKVTIYRCGAENLPWKEIKNIDCAFTSPPYFSTEEYNKGGEHEEDQSWFKFNEYDKWRDDFYLPVSLNSHKSLSENGFLFVNIMDPKIKGTRYYSCDELVDSLEEYFIGQIGMRIMQRPQGNAKFKTKEELNEFMNMLFIENVWCFYSVDSCIANHTGHSNLDLFRHSRTTTLDNFLE